MQVNCSIKMHKHTIYTLLRCHDLLAIRLEINEYDYPDSIGTHTDGIYIRMYVGVCTHEHTHTSTIILYRPNHTMGPEPMGV